MPKIKRRLNGEGTIKKRKNGLFEYQFTDLNGKRRSIYAKNMQELKIKIQETKIKLYKGDPIFNSTITIGELYKQIINKKLKLNIIQPNTYARNLETFKTLEAFNIANMYISKTNIKDIENFLIELVQNNYSQSYINKCLIAIKQVFKEAFKSEIISKDKIQYIQAPKSKKEAKKVKALSLEEQNKFEEVLYNSRYYMQYLIAINTGLRIGEINALQKKDIDLNKKIIEVSKTLTRDAEYKTILKKRY